MTLRACIAGLREKGEISAEQSAYLDDLYDRLAKKASAKLGPAAGEALASRQALEAATRSLAEEKRLAVMQIAAERAMLDDTGKYRGKRGEWSFGKAAAALLGRDERGLAISNAEYKQRALHSAMLGRLRELTARHGPDIAGNIRDKAGLADILKELFGVDSGNANAKAIARAWREVAEEMRTLANAAGASIEKNDDWRITQNHDPLRTRQAAGADATMDDAYRAWRDAELPRLARDRMLDRETGDPLDDEGMERVLRYAFDSIVTDGWAHREEGSGGQPSVAKRLSASRVLIYKDAESWLASHAQFGRDQTVYDAMMGHVASMSRDIALMQRLGPNPAAGVRWLADVVQKRAATEHGAGSEQEEAAHKAAQRIRRYYDTLAGQNRRPDDRRLAALGEALRGWQVTTKLGSAALSTPSDVATGVLTRAFNGLPMAEIVTGYAKYLNPANEADRMHAARMGFVAEQAGSALAGTGRMMAEEMGSEIVKRLAEGTLRLSGLNAITDAGRMSYGDGLMAHVTRERSKPFDALDDKFREQFTRYGLDAAAWDELRATPIMKGPSGADWIVDENIANRPLAQRVLEMAYSEMDVAVPTSGLATRAGLDRVAPKGTWQGEAIRTLFQFKAFPVTLMMIQWQRAMAMESGFDRLAAFGMFFGASALAGAFALQMKEIAKGRDPRPMATRDFLIEAIAQGGGAGIYGDFVRSTDSRFGSGPLQVISGPGIETLTSLGNLTVGNMQKAAKGENTHVARDLTTLARSNTPVVGSLWWTRLVYERAALDTMRRAADPMADAAFGRMERKYERDYNQRYWSAPGSGLGGMEMPDLTTAFDPPPAPKTATRRAGW